jgi:hypothetical protein
VLITLTGTYFKDRGVVTASNGIDVLTCQTPPPGTVGNTSGLYYKPDGTHIQVWSSPLLVAAACVLMTNLVGSVDCLVVWEAVTCFRCPLAASQV